MKARSQTALPSARDNMGGFDPENKNDLQIFLQIVFVFFPKFWALSDQLSQMLGDIE